MESLKFRTSFAGSIGNLLEWYDFAVFGYFAPFIGAQFFPTDDPMSALINTFGVFAAGNAWINEALRVIWCDAW